MKPEWVQKRFNEQSPLPPDGRGFLILEAYTGDPVDYLTGHIPGAISVDTNAFEQEPLWKVAQAEQLAQVLLTHGIIHDQTVVVYGRNQLAAARTALVLMYAGVSDVRLLKGGIEAWTDCGYELETVARDPLPVEAFGLKIPAHPEYLVDANQTLAYLSDNNVVLACVRSWEEYIGEISGYDYIQAKGRIPGSIWAGQAGTGGRDKDPSRIVDQPLLHRHDITAIWQERGITPDKKVVFYCGTGWRASEAFFYAYSQGWENICIFDSGWLEWSTHPDYPVETGEPEGLIWKI